MIPTLFVILALLFWTGCFLYARFTRTTTGREMGIADTDFVDGDFPSTSPMTDRDISTYYAEMHERFIAQQRKEAEQRADHARLDYLEKHTAITRAQIDAWIRLQAEQTTLSNQPQ